MRLRVETGGQSLGDLSQLPRERPYLLGEGGAGEVWMPPGAPLGHCVKIYHDKRAAGHAHKVEAMIAAPPDGVLANGVVQLAWPSSRVITEDGRFVGFTMPVVDFANSWPGETLVSAGMRRAYNRMHPDNQVDWSVRLGLVVAINLCRVVKKLHKRGHHIIDLKPENFRVYNRSDPNATGLVAFLDCDGFDIARPSGGRLPAKMHTPLYSHAEAMRRRGPARQAWLDENGRRQDQWSLAVLVFMLLNDGLHPMSGRPSVGGPEAPKMAWADNIARASEVWAYGAFPSRLMAPDPTSLHPWFDRRLIAFFDRTFRDLSPPSASEWDRLLTDLNASGRECPAGDENHWRIGDSCPMCARAALLPPALVPGDEQTPLPQTRRKWSSTAPGPAGGARGPANPSVSGGPAPGGPTRWTAGGPSLAQHAAPPMTLRQIFSAVPPPPPRWTRGMPFLMRNWRGFHRLRLLGAWAGARLSGAAATPVAASQPVAAAAPRRRWADAFAPGAAGRVVWLRSLWIAPLLALAAGLALAVLEAEGVLRFASSGGQVFLALLLWLGVGRPLLFRAAPSRRGGARTPLIAVLLLMAANAVSAGATLAFIEDRRDSIPPLGAMVARLTDGAAPGAAPEAAPARAPASERALDQALAPPLDPAPDEARAIVRDIQLALRARGLYDGPIDGIAGPGTRGGTDRFFALHPDRRFDCADALDCGRKMVAAIRSTL